jgi:hypothetical protein
VLATVAVASGLSGMLAGPAVLPGGGPVNPTIDSEYRFTNAFWFAAGLIVWWAVPRIDKTATVLRVTLGAVFLGGLARLIAVAASGWPHPIFRAAMVIELILIPALLWWQTRTPPRNDADQWS